MSVTFFTNEEAGVLPTEEPCLCAQDAPSWRYPATTLDRDDLRRHANPGCWRCGGSGVEVVEYDDRDDLNLANENAKALLGLLRLGGEPWGEVSIVEARRRLLRARATFDVIVDGFVREDEVLHGGPIEVDGVIELRRVRGFSSGLSKERIAQHLETLARLVETGASRGADSLRWE